MYRRKLKHSRVKSLFKFVSAKMNQTMTVESYLEFDTCFHLEYSSSITSFAAQPEGFLYRFDGRDCSYTPDFQIVENDEVKWIEEKPFIKTQRPDFLQRFKVKQEKALALGVPLILVTEKQIRVNPVLNNLKILHRYSGFQSLTDLHIRLLSLVKTVGKIRVSDAASRLGIDQGMMVKSAFSLVSSGMLTADLVHDELGLHSIVWSEHMAKDISTGLFQDEMTVASSSEPVEALPSSTDDFFERDLASYPDEIQIEVRRRIEYLQWIEKHLVGGWTQKNLVPLIAKASVEINYPPPKWRTIAKWWSVYSLSGKVVSSLIPKLHRKGNRKRKVTNEASFFDRAIERYLVPERPSIAAIYQYYSDLIQLENQKLVGDKIQALSYKGFYNRIKKLPAYEVAVARHGKYLADMEFNKIDAHLPPSRVLEKVEIDHSPLDLILLDDELDIPLGRPYLTLLIDQYSKSIVGFHLGFKEPSYYSVMKAILNAIKPKEYISKRFTSVEHGWYCQGKMELLVVDNGAEFWSKSLEQSCLEVGIHIQYNPVRKPWLKPLVERIFRTIGSKLLVSIPGKTFSNILAREEYDSRKDAVMHFSTFNELFHKWIIDVYHYESDSRKRAIPYVKWQEGVSVMPPISYESKDLEKLSVILGIKERRKHRRGGIHLHGLRYDSEELADYRRMYPRDIDVLTKTNPDDISSIYVYLDHKQQYLKVPCIDPIGYTKTLSLTQHHINQRLHRDFIDGQLDLEGLARVRMYIHERIEKEAEEINNLNRGRSKRTTKGIARLAKHNGVASDAETSCVPKILPELSMPDTAIPPKQLPESDEWDDFISELDPY